MGIICSSRYTPIEESYDEIAENLSDLMNMLEEYTIENSVLSKYGIFLEKDAMDKGGELLVRIIGGLIKLIESAFKALKTKFEQVLKPKLKKAAADARKSGIGVPQKVIVYKGIEIGTDPYVPSIDEITKAVVEKDVIDDDKFKAFLDVYKVKTTRHIVGVENISDLDTKDMYTIQLVSPDKYAGTMEASINNLITDMGKATSVCNSTISALEKARKDATKGILVSIQIKKIAEFYTGAIKIIQSTQMSLINKLNDISTKINSSRDRDPEEN